MKIIVCCKTVPEEEQIVVLKNRELSFDAAPWKIGAYDLNALETGKRLIAEAGGSMTALSIGTAALKESKLRKDILSRGASDLSVLITDTVISDSLMAAKAIVHSVAQVGDFDLILCGTGSSDLYAQQVGNQVGALLDLPVVNAVSKVTPGDGVVVVERTLENEVEVLEITLPAVLSVTSDINIPAIPGMRDIMGAGKKPVTELSVEGLALSPAVHVVSDLAPAQKDRRKEVLEGESDEVIDALVQFLKRELA